MRKIKFIFNLLFIFLFSSCKKEEEAIPITKSNEAKLLSFNLKKDNNSSLLSADVVGCIKTIQGLSENILTLNTPITDAVTPQSASIIPSFSISKGATLLIDGKPVESDKTNLKVTSQPIIITVKAEDGTEQKYTMKITSQILNISTFLSTCPKDDPAFSQIIKDFEFRKNGIKMNILDFDCNNKMDVALKILQVIRVYYYVDLYKPKGYLPFTNLRLYDWLKAEVNGFDIKDNFTAAAACCQVDQGKKFILMSSGNNDGDKYVKYTYSEWTGLSGLFSLVGHERRHADPTGYMHTGNCNNIAGDPDYNEANLGAYGVAYWLSKAFKTGVLEVGVACLNKQKQDEINNITGVNYWAATYFCKNAPPVSWPANYAPCTCE